MANSNKDGAESNPCDSKDSGLDKSFVGKFVSGFLSNTPLSKWFAKDSTSKSVIRRREEDDDYDSSCIFQPPVKRARAPSDVERNSYSAHLFDTPVTVHNASNNVNNVSSGVFAKFPEPVAGPSGVKSRKLFEAHNSMSTNTASTNSFENHDVVNGDNDTDSEESTSGYSSAPKLLNKEKTIHSSSSSILNTSQGYEKTAKPRSLFTSSNSSEQDFTRTNTLMNTSLSSRRPTFNASTFGSPTFVDRTLSTERIMSSPFYSGHTTYGGASAYGRRFGKTSDDSSSRVSIQIKPVNDRSTGETATLSKTARRILNTLEQYSTPVSDAKKIPVASRKEGILTRYVGANPYLVRDRNRPLKRELQMPSVPDLLQMKQKERLQNSTESVRQIATTSKSTLNKEEYRLRPENDSKQKHSNKMKSNIGAMRPKMQSMEPVSDVKLPKVSLPITTLPKFDFVMIHPDNSNKLKESPTINVGNNKKQQHPVKTSTVEAKIETVEKATTKEKVKTYKFSKPLVISDEMKFVAPINCFKFNEPLNKKKCTEQNNSHKSAIKVKNNGEHAVAKEKKPVCSSSNEPKKVDDFGSQFKLSSDKWECGACLVRNNNSDSNCVSCSTAKDKPPPIDKLKIDKPPVVNNFGNQFKPANDTWECGTCMIRNKNNLDRCVACETLRDGVAPPKKTGSFTKFSFGIKQEWECKKCLVKNKDDLKKCAACGASRDNIVVEKNKSFGETFKLKTGEWECASCLVKNKQTANSCVCCGATKPGEKQPEISQDKKQPVISFNFGIDKSTTAPFKFGVPVTKNEETKEDSKTSTSAVFGECSKPVAVTSSSFSFGVPPQEKTSEISVTSTKGSDSTDVINKPLMKPDSNPLLKPDEKLPEKATPAPPTFSFGFGTTHTTNASLQFTTSSPKTTMPVSTASSSSSDAVKPPPMFQFKPLPMNGDVNKPSSDINKVAASPFATARSKGASFESGTSKSETSMFNSELGKSKETVVFGGDLNKSTGVFGCDVNKPNVSFDVNKPKEVLFASKPTGTANIFANANSIFHFTQNLQNPAATVTSNALATTQASSPPMFKFTDSSQVVVPTNKKPSESNGFAPAPAKIPPFGSPEGYAKKPFSFAESTPPNPGFSFGQTEKPAAANAPVFGFGSGAGAGAPPGGVAFSFAAASAPSAAGGFGFAGGAAATSKVAPNNFGGGGGGGGGASGIFSNVATASKNGSFNFGTAANNNNNKAIFTFGASQAQATSQTGFPTQNQPGFNFGAPVTGNVPSVPPGAFNFTGVPPSFNFTDGSSAAAPPQRKIKRALRRTQR